MDLQLAFKYKMKKRIGGGSFGEIYLAEQIESNKEFAVKLEKIPTKSPQLVSEYRYYRLFSGATGIPNVVWFGTEDNYNILILDYLGPSLRTLFQDCHKKFSLKTVLMVADQLITRLQYMHSKGVIHRDIKPDNFVIGRGNNSNIIYVIDFGLSRKYCDSRTHAHIPFKDGKSLAGTARYTSINTHMGIEQSRRDDLEGVAYLLILFLKGSLPWQSVEAKTKEEKFLAISKLKQQISIQELCSGIPPQFATFLSEVRGLAFDEIPDYSFYRSLFRELFISQGYIYDGHYDWSPPPPVPLSFSYSYVQNEKPSNQYLVLQEKPSHPFIPRPASKQQNLSKNSRRSISNGASYQKEKITNDQKLQSRSRIIGTVHLTRPVISPMKSRSRPSLI